MRQKEKDVIERRFEVLSTANLNKRQTEGTVLSVFWVLSELLVYEERLYDRIEFVDDPDVEEVGIDDVAIRKGQTYATAIYDLVLVREI